MNKKKSTAKNEIFFEDEFKDEFEDESEDESENGSSINSKYIKIDSYFIVSALIILALILLTILDFINFIDTIKTLIASNLSVSKTVFEFIAILFAKIVLGVVGVFIVNKIKKIMQK